jgi:hypothetical protein
MGFAHAHEWGIRIFQQRLRSIEKMSRVSAGVANGLTEQSARCSVCIRLFVTLPLTFCQQRGLKGEFLRHFDVQQNQPPLFYSARQDWK